MTGWVVGRVGGSASTARAEASSGGQRRADDRPWGALSSFHTRALPDQLGEGVGRHVGEPVEGLILGLDAEALEQRSVRPLLLAQRTRLLECLLAGEIAREIAREIAGEVALELVREMPIGIAMEVAWKIDGAGCRLAWATPAASRPPSAAAGRTRRAPAPE